MGGDITESVIIDALGEEGIKAAEEYYPSEMPMPYAVVLVPESEIDASDQYELAFVRQRFRAELYTKTKADPLRNKFKRIMLSLGGMDIEFEEQSYGKGRCYLTACEFSALNNADFMNDDEEEE